MRIVGTIHNTLSLSLEFKELSYAPQKSDSICSIHNIDMPIYIICNN